MSKAKNRPPSGIPAAEATIEFDKRVNDDEDAVVDYCGTHKGFEARVGVVVATQIIDRKETRETQSYQIKDKEIKKATQSDIDKLHLKIHTNMDQCAGITSSMDKKEKLKFIASSVDETGDSLFDGEVMRLGGIKGFGLAAQEEEDAEPAEEENDAKSEAWHHKVSILFSYSFQSCI